LGLTKHQSVNQNVILPGRVFKDVWLESFF